MNEQIPHEDIVLAFTPPVVHSYRRQSHHRRHLSLPENDRGLYSLLPRPFSFSTLFYHPTTTSSAEPSLTYHPLLYYPYISPHLFRVLLVVPIGIVGRGRSYIRGFPRAVAPPPLLKRKYQIGLYFFSIVTFKKTFSKIK